MKNTFTALVFLIIFSSSFLTKTNAQDCFGLGSIVKQILFGGLHGGYGFQEYSAKGFNNYIKVFNEDPSKNFSQKMDEFGFAKGFKFGLNLFQFLMDDWIIGMKLSYHILQENHESVQSITNGILRNEFELTLKSFHAGLSFGYYVSKHLDIKIADLVITFNSVDFENKKTETNQPDVNQEYTSFENPIGLNIATGFTFYVIPPYVSVEGTFGYAVFSIDEMRDEDTGRRLPVFEGSDNIMTNFIDGGGLYGFAQLNIAIPFN